MLTVDGRCGCNQCRTRTENIYRMIGTCRNCGTTPILLLYRAGDKASEQDCPVCGNWHTVQAQRIATADELPVADDRAAALRGIEAPQPDKEP
jgi:hypothetical protein